MVTTAARRPVAALRDPARAARLARALWMTWAFVVWNVIVDHTIVTAGRSYIVAAVRAAATHAANAPVVRMDDWMRPAVARGVWTASAANAVIVVTGLALVHRALGAGPRLER